jgi:serine/threonine-protein kinase HipA
MSAEPLLVVLDGRLAGDIAHIRGGRLRLRYADDYREDPASTPLSLSMPLASREHSHTVVWPFLWGLLPDSDAVLTRWGREFQVSAANPFALLRYVGEDCAGAVQFLTQDRYAELYGRESQPTRTDSEVDWLSENQVAERLAALRLDPAAWHFTAESGEFSLAGAQAKVALFYDGKRWGRPTGRMPTTHILKPAIPSLLDHDLNEHLCLGLARRLGLRAARSELMSFGGERAIVVTRYDRVHESDGWRRVHQEDLCQALAVHPGSKYEYEGGPFPAKIVALFRAAMEPDRVAETVDRFSDALVLNWLMVGTDAHAKNYSLLLAGPQVRLAPLYDLASTTVALRLILSVCLRS